MRRGEKAETRRKRRGPKCKEEMKVIRPKSESEIELNLRRAETKEVRGPKVGRGEGRLRENNTRLGGYLGLEKE